MLTRHNMENSLLTAVKQAQCMDSSTEQQSMVL